MISFDTKNILEKKSCLKRQRAIQIIRDTQGGPGGLLECHQRT